MSDWIENSTFHQHAVDCGVDMTGSAAVGIDGDAIGCTLSHTMLHPVSGEIVLEAGTALELRHIERLQQCGFDYVPVEAIDPLNP